MELAGVNRSEPWRIELVKFQRGKNVTDQIFPLMFNVKEREKYAI